MCFTSCSCRPHPGAVKDACLRTREFVTRTRHKSRDRRHVRDVIVKAPLAVVVLLAGALLGIPVVIGGNGSSTAAALRRTSRHPRHDPHGRVRRRLRRAEEPGRSVGRVPVHRQHLERLRGLRVRLPRATRDPRRPRRERRPGDPRHLRRRRVRPNRLVLAPSRTDPSQLDIVPMPGAGNRLTVREYQPQWLAIYETKAAAAITDVRRRHRRPKTATPYRSTGRSSPPTRRCSTSRTTTTRRSTS